MVKKGYEALIKVANRAYTLSAISKYWADVDPLKKELKEAIEKLPDQLLTIVKERDRFPFRKHFKFNDKIEPLIQVAVYALKLSRAEDHYGEFEKEQKRLDKALNSLPEDILSKVKVI